MGFPSNVLRDILRSDALAISHEGELLESLMTYGDSELQKCDDECGNFDKLIPAVRLRDIRFSKLLDSAKLSPSLQRSSKFSEMLKQLVKDRIVSPPDSGADCSENPEADTRNPRGYAARQAVNSHAIEDRRITDSADMDRPSVDALVQWLLRPAPGTIETTIEKTDEHPCTAQDKPSAMKERTNMLNVLSRIEAIVAEHASSGCNRLVISGLAVEILRNLSEDQLAAVMEDSTPNVPCMFNSRGLLAMASVHSV